MGAQTGDFLVGHGASLWIKKSTENGKANGGVQSLMNASFVPTGLIVNKVRRFTLADKVSTAAGGPLRPARGQNEPGKKKR